MAKGCRPFAETISYVAPGEANLRPAQGKRFARENPRRKHGGGGHGGANRAIQAVPEFLLTGSQYKPTLIAVEESLGVSGGVGQRHILRRILRIVRLIVLLIILLSISRPRS